MKTLLIVSALFLFGGAVLMSWVSEDTGYIIIHYNGKTLESSFWFGLLSIITLVIILRYVVKLCTGSWKLAGGSVRWLSNAKKKKNEHLTHTGLIHFIEGNWQAAKKELLHAAKSADKPLVHYLAAARSAYEMGCADETQQLLHKAEKVAPQNELAIALSQARIQLLDKKYEQCLATLERIKPDAPHHPVVLDLLQQTYWHLRDWRSLVGLFPELRSSKLHSAEEQHILEENVYKALLLQGAESVDERSSQEILPRLWQEIPKKHRKQPSLITHYAKLLHRYGLDDMAEPLIKAALEKSWSDPLVCLYGQLNLASPKSQLLVVQHWLRTHPADANVLLASGRVSLKNQLWGQARDYFEESLALKASPQVCAELAKLLAQLGEHQQSTALYQKGLLLTV